MVHEFVKNVRYRKIPSPTRHLLITGLSGYGKDFFGEFYISQKMKGNKVIDVFSDIRGEGFFYEIPNDNKFLMKRLKFLTNGQLKPKKFKQEIIMFNGTRLADYPELPANVKVVTFRQKDLTNDDLMDFIAYNDTQRGLLDMLFYYNKKTMTLDDVEDYLRKSIEPNTEENRILKGGHIATKFTMLRRIAAIKQSGLFHEGDRDLMDEFDPLKCVQDKDTITTFSTMLLPRDDLRGLALGLAIKKIIDMRRKNLDKERNPVVLYVRELSGFYADAKATYYSLIKSQFNFILREGRDNLFTLVANTQLPTDVPEYVLYNFNNFFCLKVPEPKFLQRKAMIPNKYIDKLKNLTEPGIGMYVSNGSFRYPVRSIPTLHLKKTEGFDVLDYLSSIYGKKNFEKSEYLSKLDLELTTNRNTYKEETKSEAKEGVSAW